MVRIKLKRIGKKKQPYYNIVIMEQLSYIKGKYLDKVGFFNPLKDNDFYLNVEKIQDWIKKGAIPSNRIKSLLKILKNN